MSAKGGATSGKLYVVATPIGNLGDLSPRAAEVLREVDVIACEDTRVTGKLLKHTGCDRPALSYREENEARLAPELAERIADGETMALVADAGTPLLSDPGFRLVRECRRRGLTVTPIPGPSAALTALSASGLPSDCFTFAGFLPARAGARRTFFEQNRTAQATLILYESTHRIGKFLDDLIEVLGGERVICVARELTKRHETMHTGRAAEVRTQVMAGSTKGEFTILIAREGFVL